MQAAVAMLGKFFYKWNERKGNHMKNVVMTVESYFLSNHSLFQTTERFGVKDRSFEKEEYANYQIGSDSSVLSIFKEEESDCDSDNEDLEAIVIDLHSDTEENEISKWDINAEHIKNLVKQGSNKAKMIYYIKDCGKTELFEPRFFTSLTAALFLLNSSSASETSNEKDEAESLKEIYNSFWIPFRAIDLKSLFFEGMNNDFLINFILTEDNSIF